MILVEDLEPFPIGELTLGTDRQGMMRTGESGDIAIVGTFLHNIRLDRLVPV